MNQLFQRPLWDFVNSSTTSENLCHLSLVSLDENGEYIKKHSLPLRLKTNIINLIAISSHSQFDKNVIMASIWNGSPWNVKQDREEFITSGMFMEAGTLSYSFYYNLLCRSRKVRFQQSFWSYIDVREIRSYPSVFVLLQQYVQQGCDCSYVFL